MRLLTNLSYVRVYNGADEGMTGMVRTNTHALLLEEGLSIFHQGDPPQKIRGFGGDPAWPVFDLWLDCPWQNYTVTTDNVSTVLTFADGKRLVLDPEDTKRPLREDNFDEITDVWKVLTDRVAEYHQAPAMAVSSYLPPQLAAERQRVFY